VARPYWRRLPADNADRGKRGQLTAIGTVVALSIALAGRAIRRYLVRALALGAVAGGEGASVKFENTGVVNS
jgi:hypothetical protein